MSRFAKSAFQAALAGWGKLQTALSASPTRGRGDRKAKGGFRPMVDLLEIRAVPATFAVTNLNDGAVGKAGDQPGTLRQAIFDANAAAGADEIVFTGAGAAGTITLTNGELTVNTNITIIGTGVGNLIVDGNLAGRVFNFTAGTSTVTDMTIQRGSAGGGAGARAGDAPVLTLRRVLLTGNVGNGNGGGAMVTSGTMTIIDSTIDNNTSANNGAGLRVNNTGTLFVRNSTISNNTTTTAARDGGGIHVSSAGATLRIFNSTVSGNTTTDDGGAIAVTNGSRAFLYNNTMASNVSAQQGEGVAVFNPGSVISNLTSNIIANNNSTGTTNEDMTAGAGRITVEASNLVEVGTGNIVANGVNGSIVGVDPNLGALADNGGLTRTQAFAGAAIDAGRLSVPGVRRTLTTAYRPTSRHACAESGICWSLGGWKRCTSVGAARMACDAMRAIPLVNQEVGLRRRTLDGEAVRARKQLPISGLVGPRATLASG